MQSAVRGTRARVAEVWRALASRLGARAQEWGRVVGARWATASLRPERGMATAEYAIATLAAVAFAGLLLVIMRSDEVRGMLLGIIREALSR